MTELWHLIIAVLIFADLETEATGLNTFSLRSKTSKYLSLDSKSQGVFSQTYYTIPFCFLCHPSSYGKHAHKII